MLKNNIAPSWLEIDLDALRYNLKQVKKRLKKETQIMAIVKGNAYGHGFITVAKEAIKAGADRLGVATVAEGIKLRQAGIKVPILILSSLFYSQIEFIGKYDLTPTIYTYETAEALSKLERRIKVHFKVDTGMGRIGSLPKEAIFILKRIRRLPNLTVEGIFTHFAVADEEEEYTKEQMSAFQSVLKKLKEEGIKIPIKHLANSAAIIKYPETHYDAVRVGLILYGLYPTLDLRDKIDLKPVLSWKAKVAYVKELPPGESISYGCTYTTAKPTKVATLSVGYHDGYSRKLSNQSEILYNGKRYPVIGRVCMDQFMVDMTGAEVKRGEVVTLLGEEKGERITPRELAEKIGTINYEIVSKIGPRIPRIFYRNGEIVR